MVIFLVMFSKTAPCGECGAESSILTQLPRRQKRNNKEEANHARYYNTQQPPPLPARRPRRSYQRQRNADKGQRKAKNCIQTSSGADAYALVRLISVSLVRRLQMLENKFNNGSW